MPVVLDLLNNDTRPRHPEKAHRPDQPVLRKPDWIRVQGARLAAMARDAGDRQGEQARHGLRGGGLPQYRRVLGQEARHLHDHGRHLHAGLRLLQRQDRHAGRARPATSRRTRPSRSQKLGLAHVVITSVDRDDLADGGAAHFAAVIACDPRAQPRHDDRGPDARLPAQARRARDRRRGQARRVQPQPRDGRVEISDGPARRALFPLAAAACSRSRRSIRRSSPNPASWSDSARSGTKCCS